MIRAIILDLDDTIIDTSALKPLRTAGRWQEIHKYLNHCSVHESVLGLLNTVRSAGIKIAVFTDSPSNYVQKLLTYFDINVDFVVAYHDVINHKPHKDGVETILSYFNIRSNEAIYLGDSDLDKKAAASAGVEFFSVDWANLTGIDQDHIGVSRLSEFIGTRFRFNSNTNVRSGLQRSSNSLYLGYYLEGIKQEVLAFKKGQSSAIQRWSNKAVELATHFPVVDIVVRALGHSELKVTGIDTPLDHLAFNLANALNASYKPDLIEKSRVLVKSTNLSGAERQTQVAGAYSVSSNQRSKLEFSKRTFLIVDDVLTTGATTKEIVRAISKAFPESCIYVFTLVKTLYRVQVDKASIEKQHNTQLYADLYSPIKFDENIDCVQVISEPRKLNSKLQTKIYSANYARTNHNFVFNNLKHHSIASEVDSISLFSVIQILKNILQRGKPTIASRRIRSAFGLELSESGIETNSLALISNKPVVWHRLIRGDEKSRYYPAKRFFDELLPKHLGDYGFIKQLIVPEVQLFDITQVYVEQFQNRLVDFFIPQVGLIIEIDGLQHQVSSEVDATRDAFTETLGLKTVRFTTQELVSENVLFLQKMGFIKAHIQWIDNLERNGVFNPPNGITLQDYKTAYADGIDCADPRMRLTSAIRFQLLLLELLERGVLRLGKSRKLLFINRDKVDFVWDALEDFNDLLANLLRLQGLSEELLDLTIEELDPNSDNKCDSHGLA